MKTLSHYLHDRLGLGKICVVKTEDGFRTYKHGVHWRYVPKGELIGVYEATDDRTDIVDLILADMKAEGIKRW